MAISKILHMKDTGSYHGKHLKLAIDYILKDEKTQELRLTGAINCQLSNAFRQMKETKQKFGKADKRQGYHLIISFDEGEVDGDTAFSFVQEFVTEYLGSSYEAVYAVHDNTDHVHAHIIFNSVSFLDGKKFRYEKGDWARYIQPVTNSLCEKYGLSTIEIEEDGRKQREYQNHNVYRDGAFVWGDMIKRDIDACILQAVTYDSFLELLAEKGYEIKNAHGEGKYLSVKPQGMSRFKRLKTLGEEYSEEQIRKRILTEDIATVYRKPKKARIVYCKVKRYRRAKLSGIQKQYYRRLYETGRLKQKPYSQAWKYKDEIKKMEKLQEQYLFLVRHDIHSMEDLQKVSDLLADKKKEAGRERSRIYRARAKCDGLFQLANQMTELAECEECFQSGDSYFADEHEQYRQLEKRLSEQGYSYEEVLGLKEYYRGEYAKNTEHYREVSREVKIAELLKQSYASDSLPKGKEQEEYLSERERKQPMR